jgi:hypothetical protein
MEMRNMGMVGMVGKRVMEMGERNVGMGDVGMGEGNIGAGIWGWGRGRGRGIYSPPHSHVLIYPLSTLPSLIPIFHPHPHFTVCIFPIPIFSSPPHL